jgi:transposase
MDAAEHFAGGEKTGAIARKLRVTEQSMGRWRHAWEQGGAHASRSAGPVSTERLGPHQWERLEREPERGPLAHGWSDESQGWTLTRVTLLTRRMFPTGRTLQGVWRLLHRHGWPAQVPGRRALERDDEAIEAWKARVRPQVKRPRPTWAPTSASKTRRGSG